MAQQKDIDKIVNAYRAHPNHPWAPDGAHAAEAKRVFNTQIYRANEHALHSMLFLDSPKEQGIGRTCFDECVDIPKAKLPGWQRMCMLDCVEGWVEAQN